MKDGRVSELTTNRLSVYLRCLNELDSTGVRNISSERLAKQFHLNSAQIRKDLAYFGEFGVRGVGYKVGDLRRHLHHILGLDRHHSVCIVGAGRLGMALADYYGLTHSNFTVRCLFDSDPRKIGRKVGTVAILDIKNFADNVKKDNIEVAVIAVPAEFARAVIERVVNAGIRAVMNFAPVAVKVADDVKLKTIDLTTSLESLSYFLAQPSANNGKRLKPVSKAGRNK